MSELLSQGFQLMGYGLAGVFVVLALFIAMISILVRVCKDPADRQDGSAK